MNIHARVIGFPTNSIQKYSLLYSVERTLRKCSVTSLKINISNELVGQENGGNPTNKIPEALQEILVFFDISGTIINTQPWLDISDYNSFQSFLHNWLDCSSKYFQPADIPWLVVTDKKFFKSSRASFNEIVPSLIAFGSVVSSSLFQKHKELSADTYFYHDMRILKLVYNGVVKKVFILNYSSIRHIIVFERKVLIIYSNPPVVKNEDETELVDPHPLPSNVLGKSNGILLPFQDIDSLNEVISRLHFRCSNIPIMFVPFMVQEITTFPALTSPTCTRGLEFRCNYLIEALFRQKFNFVIQGLAVFQNCAISLSHLNPDLVEKCLTDLLQLTELGYPLNYKYSLELLFNREMKQADSGKQARFIPEKTKLVRTVVITPTRVLLWPPEIIVENRILRNFNSDYALRVSFRDDNFAKLNRSLPLPGEIVNCTIRNPMIAGLEIAGRKYEFLAWSNSQIREHSVWMYASDDHGKNAAGIRKWMGDFTKIYTVPKLMARMGQCFSQTADAVGIPMTSQHIIFEQDIERGFDPETKKPYCFSDGIGRISLETVQKVCKSQGIAKNPSAFQIRYGGCKGMLVLDPNLTDKSIIFRESMRKFQSDNERLEIVKHSTAGSLFLNRPMIAIMNHLGVKTGTLLRIQEDALETLTEMLLDSQKAAEYLAYHNNLRGVNFQDVLDSGIDLSSEPFFRAMLLARHQHDVSKLRKKARLPIDPSQGRNMFGVLDETGTLSYGQVFVQYTTNIIGQETNLQKTIHIGDVLVSKNPCYLPGDVRIFKCVNVPALHHIVDCIVFPQLGERPHPNELSGSDLDGDEYSVIWNKDLFIQKNALPGQFPAPQCEVLNRTAQVSDMVDFLCKFIQNDRIGFIASAHLATSDEIGSDSRKSIDLARYCSIAVDFPKTGCDVNLSKDFRPIKYPDFMERGYRESYKSKKALGKLFRICRDFQASSSAVIYSYQDIKYDCDLVYPGWENYELSANKSLEKYTHYMEQLLSTYGVKHESEAMTGAFSDIHSRFQETKDRFETEELVAIYVRGLWKKTKEEFMEEFKQVESNPSEKMLQKASAWYIVTYKQVNPSFISFPWILASYLAHIKQLNISKRHLVIKPALSKVLQKLNSDLQNIPLPPVSNENAQIIYSSNLTVFVENSFKTLIEATTVLLHWAREKGLLPSPANCNPPREGFMKEGDLTNLLLHVASKETKNWGVIPLIISFFRFCISLRFLSGDKKRGILPFPVKQSGFLSRQAMLTYRDLAITANISALNVGTLSRENEIVDMEPIMLQNRIFGGDTVFFRSILAKLSGVNEISFRKSGKWRWIVNAYGPLSCVRTLERILLRGDNYLKDLVEERRIQIEEEIFDFGYEEREDFDDPYLDELIERQFEEEFFSLQHDFEDDELLSRIFGREEY